MPRHICFDRVLERPPSQAQHAFGLKDGFLKQNEVITFFYRGGNLEHYIEFDTVFKEVESFTNLKFEEGVSWETSLVRITFDESLGSWSYVGNDNYHTDPSQPTMNIGWLGLGTKRHEIGHCLGLHHEHSNPKEPIQWNIEEVTKDLSGPPNNWTEGQIRFNMFNRFSEDQIRGTEKDPKSIMHYPIPKEWTLNGYEVGYNEEWSEMDIEFLKSAYPKAIDTGAIDSFKGLWTSKRALQKNYVSTIKNLSNRLNITYKNKTQAVHDIWEVLK